MYMSKDFAVADRQRQIDFIQNTGWGYLTGVIDGAPFVTHLPFMVGGGGRRRATGGAHGACQSSLAKF